MINYGKVRMEAIQKKIDELKAKQTSIPSDKWDRLYMQLKGIKGYWNELTWDEILIECPELEWVKPIRADETFKQFYKLMGDLDQLKQLEV